MDSANHPDHSLNFLKSVTFLVIMFGVGFSGSIIYSRFFTPPTAPPPGKLLGITDTNPQPTTPPPTPTPNMGLIPKEISKPPKGQITYLKGGQIYLVNADRTQNLPLTSDQTQKSGLTISKNQQLLAYSFKDELSKPPTHGIGLYDFKTKKVEVLLNTQNLIYQSLSFSPDNRYLSAWNTNGQEVIVVDIPKKTKVLTYSTEDQSGVSPIVWLPLGTNAISFILKGELFTGTVDGTNLKSIAKNVIGVKTDSANHDLPVVPVWSANGRYVSYFRANGLYFFDLDAQTETTVVSAAKDYALDQIPYQAVGFTEPDVNLIYQSLPNEGGKNVFIYHLKDKQNQALAAYGSTSLLNRDPQVLFGLLDTETVSHLAQTAIADSQEKVCDAVSQSYPLPPYPNLVNAPQKAMLTLTHEADIYNLQVVNTDTCTAYDLIKSATPIADPNWLYK